MSIIIDRPPNFDRILVKFPHASHSGVVFAYGGHIFNPSGVKIPKHIQRHEEEHCRRQLLIGVESWWNQYIENTSFRYWEEVLAHREEWLSQARGTVDEAKRRKYLRLTADRLIAPLYNWNSPWIDQAYAMNDILFCTQDRKNQILPEKKIETKA